MNEEMVFILIGIVFNIMLVLLLITAWRLLSPARPSSGRASRRPARRRTGRSRPAASLMPPPETTAGARLEGLFRFDSELHRPLTDEDVASVESEAVSMNGRVDRMAR